MKAVECPGSFKHLCCALKLWQLKNTWGFTHVTSQLVHLSPNKNEIYKIWCI